MSRDRRGGAREARRGGAYPLTGAERMLRVSSLYCPVSILVKPPGVGRSLGTWGAVGWRRAPAGLKGAGARGGFSSLAESKQLFIPESWSCGLGLHTKGLF